MIYDQTKEVENFSIPSRGHPLSHPIRLIGDRFTQHVDSLLKHADELIFQKHPEASIPMLLCVLNACLKRSRNDFRVYLHQLLQDKTQKYWSNHPVLIAFTDELIKISRMLTGASTYLINLVLTQGNEATETIDELSNRLQFLNTHDLELIELTHQCAKAHLKDVISRLSITPCVKSWSFYHRSCEKKMMIKPYLLHPQALLLKEFVSRISKDMSRLLKNSEALFHYHRIPSFYFLPIFFLTMTRENCNETFTQLINHLQLKTQTNESSHRFLELKEDIASLRDFSLKPLNPAILEVLDSEHRDNFTQHVHLITSSHISSVIKRLEHQKLGSIDRLRSALISRLYYLSRVL